LSFYLDTSVVVAALTTEAHTAATQDWLAKHADAELLISDWVVTEVSSALALKVRTSQIDAARRSTALRIFRRDCADTYRVLPVRSAHFRRATELVDRSATGLRAGDALHLAVSEQWGATVCTLDRALIQAADELGLPAVHP
jgi:predicted nucleic acid-binding protein